MTSDVGVRMLLDSLAAACGVMDADAIANCMDVPLLLLHAHRNDFIESGESLDQWINDEIARLRAAGIVSLAVETLGPIEALPGDAWSADIGWRAEDGRGEVVLHLPMRYTIADDEEGEAAIIAVDMTGFEAAIAAGSMVQ